MTTQPVLDLVQSLIEARDNDARKETVDFVQKTVGNFAVDVLTQVELNGNTDSVGNYIIPISKMEALDKFFSDTPTFLSETGQDGSKLLPYIDLLTLREDAKTNPYLFVTYEGDWADEFTVRGYAVILKSEWEKDIQELKDAVEKIEDRYKWAPDRYDKPALVTNYIGTNQQIDYEWLTDILDSYETRPVSDLEAIVLKNTVCNPGYESTYNYSPDFWFPCIDDMLENHDLLSYKSE
jgi:hypothetical protein